ncbi:MAG TPA: 23S rRNA (guanosine(2251)-2'-O)-methyltransferase RlmB [Candidatus Limnocylindrales bacterium]
MDSAGGGPWRLVVADRPRRGDDERPPSAGKRRASGGKPRGKPSGKAGRSGAPGARDGGRSAGNFPPGGTSRGSGPPPAGHGPDRRIPDGPTRGGAGDRPVAERGPWRPPRPGDPPRPAWRQPMSAAGGRPMDRQAPGRSFDDRDRRPPGGRGEHVPEHRPRRDAGGPPYRPGPRPRVGPPYRRDMPDRSGPPGSPGLPPERRPSYGPPGESRGPRPAARPWPRPAARPWPRTDTDPAAPWPRPQAALPPPDLLGPDEELVAGRRPVEEVFAAGRTAHRLLVVPQRRNALEQLVLHATRLRIPIVEVEGGSLTAIAGFDGHQGVALVVEPRRFATLGDILARAEERDEPPFVLVLDSLEDPQNVGTLLRSAEASGIHGVVFPTRRQAPLSPAAVKASAGATEHLLLCPVDDLAGVLADLHARGLRIAGAEADAPLTARQADLRGPLAIVIGSEGQGLGPAIRRRCDLFMRIPMRGAIGSLNAAVAGSVLLYEAVAQRDPVGRGPAPTATAAPDSDAPIDVAGAAPDVPPTATDTGHDEAASDATAADLLPGGPSVDEPPMPAKSSKPRKPRTPRA